MTSQLQKDFEEYWATATPGQVTKVGDLTYTMGEGGKATVSGPGGYSQTFTSSTNPAVLAQNPTVAQSYQTNYGVTATPPGGREALQQDLSAFQGRSRATGGTETVDGFEFRTDPSTGHIYVTTPSGLTQRFLPGSTDETIANHIPELAYAWNQKYGTDFQVQPTSPSYNWNWMPQTQIGGVKLMDMPADAPARQNIDNLYRSIYGEDPPFNWMPTGFNPNQSPQFQDVRAQYGDNPNLQQQPAVGGPFTPGGVGGGNSTGGFNTGPFAPTGGGTGGAGGPSGPYIPGGGTGTPGSTGGPGQAGAGGLLHQAQIGEVASYNPYTSEVDYNELVQNRMADALNTPYAELQRKRALDEMNSQGLLNSTLATQAADRASLDAALPIAQQDAATMTENRFRANDAINQALETNTAARNQMTKANMDALNAFGLDAKQFAQQRDLTMQEHAQQLKLADFDRNTRERLTAMTINSEEFMQANSLNQQDREFVINAAAANNEYIMGAITNIQKLEGLSEEQRATLMDEVGAIHYANLQMLQALTGAQINWNALGTGQPISSGDTTANNTQNNDQGSYADEVVSRWQDSL